MSDTALRTALRQSLLQNGVPSHAVDRVVDTSIHAANEAVASLGRIIDQCGDPKVAGCASGIAISIAIEKLGTLRASIIAHAQATGMPVKEAVVEVRT